MLAINSWSFVSEIWAAGVDLGQVLGRYGASARSARARRGYARVMDDTP